MNNEVIMNNKQRWIEEVDGLLEARNLHPKNHKVDIIETFYTTFLKDGYWEHLDYGDGFDMINILKNENNLPTIPNGNVRTNIYDIVPALKNNQTFRAIARRLTNVKMKGVGVGEILLHLLYKNSNFSFAHDFEVDGKYGELKKFEGGCLKSTVVANFRATDNASDKYLGGRDFFNKNKKSLQDNLQYLSENNVDVKGYFNEVYPMLNGQIDKWVDMFNANVNDPKKLNYLIGKEIYKLYQDIDKFDFFVLVKPTKNLDVIIINDIEDENFVLDNVSFRVMGRRGGDTNAVGDGYAKIAGVNVK
tara:strand:- start:9 stop:920 length:912 start_codon:yes stop_codon:yes gene_type:complete